MARSCRFPPPWCGPSCTVSDHAALVNEIAAQLRMFVHTFGRAPDFIDGHQHVHLFPQIRDAVLEVAKAERARRLAAAVRAGGAAARQAGATARPGCSTT